MLADELHSDIEENKTKQNKTKQKKRWWHPPAHSCRVYNIGCCAAAATTSIQFFPFSGLFFFFSKNKYLRVYASCVMTAAHCCWRYTDTSALVVCPVYKCAANTRTGRLFFVLFFSLITNKRVALLISAPPKRRKGGKETSVDKGRPEIEQNRGPSERRMCIYVRPSHCM